MYYEQCDIDPVLIPNLSQNFIPTGIFYTMDTYTQKIANRIYGPDTIAGLTLGFSKSSRVQNPEFDPSSKFLIMKEGENQKIIRTTNIDDFVDPERAWNFIGFTIEYEPLGSTGTADEFNYLVEARSSHTFYFVIDMEDLHFKLLDKSSTMMWDFGQISLGEVGKFYCNIGVPTQEYVWNYVVSCQDLNRVNSIVRHSIPKASLLAGTSLYTEMRFVIGSKLAPVVRSYLVTQFEVYQGGAIFRPDCGSSTCSQSFILEDNRMFCHNCDPLDPDLVEYLDNFSDQFRRTCVTSASLTTENKFRNFSTYEPSRVVIATCGLNYDDEVPTNICESNRSKFPDF